MIKVTREFATVEEAVAFLQGGDKLPPFLANKPGAPTPATPSAPAGNYAPAPVAPAPLPPAQPPVAAPATPAAASGITQAQIAAAAQAYSKAYKPAATKAVFAQFGITKISDANPSIYPQLLQALTVA